ncbi:MAG: hypothetical protein HY794_10205 [Desulfarculus sp.]|nr:hypothetical protein [Desulfarculus sp.]
MTEDLASQLMAHIQAKWSAEACCPLCQGTQWEVGGQCFELRPWRQGGQDLASDYFLPVLPVICSQCGHTLLLNPRAAGLTLPAAPPLGEAAPPRAPEKPKPPAKRKKKRAKR